MAVASRPGCRCRRDYKELKAKGMAFVTLMHDDPGNFFSLSQRR